MAETGIKLDLTPAQQRQLQFEARLRLERGKNEARWAEHPWPFLRDAVWTIDQQKGGDGGAKRKWPGGEINDPNHECRCCEGGCQNYLHHLVNRLHSEPEILLPKSRRLLASWTVIAYAYWRARYKEHELIGLASRKAGHHDGEGSGELVKRAWQIHQAMPPEATVRKANYSHCRLVMDNGSEIVGIAQGADQARQYTYTCYIADEFAFWEWAGKTYAALKPALEGGGQFIGLSSASPGFMEQLVFDRWSMTGGDE